MQRNTTSCGPVEVSYVVNGPIETNTYFAISGTEAVVVDPAWAGEGLAQSFVAAHPDVRIVAIVCTHGHADHVGGVAGMRRSLGPDVPYLLPADDSEMPAVNIAHQRSAWGIETGLRRARPSHRRGRRHRVWRCGPAGDRRARPHAGRRGAVLPGGGRPRRLCGRHALPGEPWPHRPRRRRRGGDSRVACALGAPAPSQDHVPGGARSLDHSGARARLQPLPAGRLESLSHSSARRISFAQGLRPVVN